MDTGDGSFPQQAQRFPVFQSTRVLTVRKANFGRVSAATGMVYTGYYYFLIVAALAVVIDDWCGLFAAHTTKSV